jgi:nitrile hydratase beta subunit
MTYTSHADIGGKTGFGRVVPEPEGELFHADWEPMAMAMNLAMGATGSWNLDTSRAARETLPGYLQMSYYQLWVAGLEKMLAERAMVLPDEIEAGRMLHPPVPVARVLHAANVPAALAKGASTLRPDVAPPRFGVGQRVRTRAEPVPHHTRLPGYARGKCGVVTLLHGCHVFADTHAHGLGEAPQHLYTVVFTGQELWGADAAPGLQVSVDAWESYLEPA